MDAHLDRLRSVFGAKRELLVTALRSAFGDAIEFQVPAGGMFLWARFEVQADTAAWLARSVDLGGCFVPGSAFQVHRSLASFARLRFANATPEQLKEAVSRMAAALQMSAGHGHGRAHEPWASLPGQSRRAIGIEPPCGKQSDADVSYVAHPGLWRPG